MELTIGDLKRILNGYSDESVVIADFGTCEFECLLPAKKRDDCLIVKEHQDFLVGDKPAVEVMLNFKPDNEMLDPDCD